MSSNPGAISSNALSALTSSSLPIASVLSSLPQSILAKATPTDVASLSSVAQQQLEVESLYGGSANPNPTNPTSSASLFDYLYSQGYTSSGTLTANTAPPVSANSQIDPTAEAQLLAQLQSQFGTFPLAALDAGTGSQINVTG